MRETKSECNGCGALHISFDYEVLVSSMGPLAGNAGLFTTLEQTQTSMSINSVLIIFEWIFTALPYRSPSLQCWMSVLRNSWITGKPHNWVVFVELMFGGKSFRQCGLLQRGWQEMEDAFQNGILKLQDHLKQLVYNSSLIIFWLSSCVLFGSLFIFEAVESHDRTIWNY